ncbi:hypothetical protein ONZ45_g17024 [Pleurotus djamor]|nr:hypothetical protein ONZ45_g17024 [Pleurotus djamor]
MAAKGVDLMLCYSTVTDDEAIYRGAIVTVLPTELGDSIERCPAFIAVPYVLSLCVQPSDTPKDHNVKVIKASIRGDAIEESTKENRLATREVKNLDALKRGE